MSKSIKTVNIIGLGALGMMYGQCMASALGNENVRFVMTKDRYDKYRTAEYKCNGKKVDFTIVSEEGATPADLCIMAVKSPAMDRALITMDHAVDNHSIIMSVMNGIASEEILSDRYSADQMIYTVAQGMDAVKFGCELNYSKSGELRIGILQSDLSENLQAVCQLLEASNLAYTVEDDILYRLWGKFMLNVGVNQTCMVYNTTYSGVLHNEEPFRCFISAMREVIAVANAEGIDLSEADLNQYVTLIGTLKPDNMPSMAQDRINHNPSEVEAFAGTLIRLANKHNLHVPTNEFLYKRVHEIESTY